MANQEVVDFLKDSRVQNGVDTTTASSAKKPFITKISFFFYCLFALTYIGCFVWDTYQILDFHAKGNSTSYLVRFPITAFLPFALSLSLVFLVYVALKTRNLSKRTWIWGIIILNLYPLLYSAILAFIDFSMSLNKGVFINEFVQRISNPINFVAILPIFLMILCVRHVVPLSKKISLAERMILVVSFFILVVPSCSITGYQLASVIHAQAKKTALNLTEDQRKILEENQEKIDSADSGTEDVSPIPTPTLNYKLYSLFTLPQGYTLSKPEYNTTLSDLAGAVAMSLDSSDKTIFITQVGVSADFILDNFLKANYTAKPSKIELKLAKDDFAYIIENNNFQNTSPTALFFITKDNVLIRVHTLTASKDILIQVARSLK
jgi:hypothetical protein